MKFSHKFRVIWWIVLLIILAILIIVLRKDIFSNNTFSINLIIIGTFIALILLPLFSEITLFGMSIKQQLEETQKELKLLIHEQTFLFSSYFQNSINNSNQSSQQINFYQPSSDEELKEKTEDVRLSIPAYMEGVDTNAKDQVPEFDVDDDVLFAFKTRYNIEKELNRLWNEVFPNPPRQELSLTSILGNIHRFGPINEELAITIKNIIAIANKEIHGVPITKVQSNFIREVTPEVLITLRNINLD